MFFWNCAFSRERFEVNQPCCYGRGGSAGGMTMIGRHAQLNDEICRYRCSLLSSSFRSVLQRCVIGVLTDLVVQQHIMYCSFVVSMAKTRKMERKLPCTTVLQYVGVMTDGLSYLITLCPMSLQLNSMLDNFHQHCLAKNSTTF